MWLVGFGLGPRRKCALGLGLALLVTFFCTGSPVAAQTSGFEVGVRTGYGLPMGSAVDDGDDLDDLISGIIPLWLDLGYRFSPNAFIGAYFQYGLGMVGDGVEDACDLDGIDCTLSSNRLGAQFHYHFSPRTSADPWLGIGFGYEWITATIEGRGGELTTSARGFELANFQFGVDFFPAEHFYLGPFLSFSLDQYDTAELDCSGAASVACDGAELFEGDIDDKSIHNWLVIGIRGGYTGVGR